MKKAELLSPAVVEAAARALFEESQGLDQDNSWDDPLPDEWRDEWRYQARNVIEAAIDAVRVSDISSTEEAG